MVSRSSSSKTSVSALINPYAFSDVIVGPNRFEEHGCNFDNWDGQSSNVLPSIQSLGERICRSIDLVQASGPKETEIFRQKHIIDLQPVKDGNTHNLSTSLGNGLSLSLGYHVSSDVLISPFHYGAAETLMNQAGPSYVTSREEQRDHVKQNKGDCSCFRVQTHDTICPSSSISHNSSSSISPNELAASSIRNSRYLKPAQTLLEEVISVGKTVEIEANDQLAKDNFIKRALLDGMDEELGLGVVEGKSLSNERNALFSCDFSSANKQQIQIKITKLIALLEEVNSRYEQYRHQMEELVCCFEVIAGIGSARSYTTLALQAMYRYFWSLRNAIVAHIRTARGCLAKCSPRKSGGLSQLSFFYQQTGQKRATLQHLGIMPTQQAWRPLRGLPENAVAILRAWLFEHFLHPYPNESEKLMLATQTGLTRSQVSNWFINARVRLWKPMIEEMYREEIEKASMDSSASTDDTPTTSSVGK